MRIMTLFLALLFAVLTSVCALADPGLRTAEQIDARTRNYPNEKAAHVTKEAAHIFELAQANYRIVYGKQGVLASREWGWETILDDTFDLGVGGSAYWYVDITQQDDGVVVQLRCVPEADPHTSLNHEDHQGGRGKLVSAATMQPADPQLDEDQNAAALYAVFFNRLDVLLGQNRHWLYCQAAQKYVLMEKLTGTLDAWCIDAGDARPGTLGVR